MSGRRRGSRLVVFAALIGALSVARVHAQVTSQRLAARRASRRTG